MECKARALFDFIAEGPNELSITAGEYLVITSNADGTDWWYAQNASGEIGAVPATYVEILPEENVAINNDENSQSQSTDYTTYQPRYEEEKRESIDGYIDTSVTATNDISAYDPLVFKNNSQQQQQQYSLLGDVGISYNIETTYDIPSPTIVVTPTETTAPVNVEVELTKSTDENSNGTKTKEKSKLFTLSRSKSKDKLRGSVENGLEASKVDSDSDDLSDSLTSSTKVSSAGSDSKSLSRTRLFDKHGLSNYLLHESKTKVEEHVDIVYDENEGGICWRVNPNCPPFSCKIENPSKETKFSGLKSFVEYKIHSQVPGHRVVGRRYKQFDWLYEQLASKYRFICIPPLPGKQIAGRFDHEFIEDRRRQLELWLNRICRHPVLCASFPVQHFLTCEITEKNNKDWKAGKRRVEKDELREAAWLYCVNFLQLKLNDAEIAVQIDTFAQQQPALETHLKSLNHNFTKYLERHTEVYEKDLQRVGELFTKLQTVVETDRLTQGNDELADLMTKIGSSYHGIAELYKTKGYEGLRDFVERIQEYLGLLSCFPIIISIQRSATEYLRNAQRNSIAPDLNGANQRNQILNHVILAEINFFQKAKVNDLKVYIKTLLDEQINFYEKITTELRTSISTLK